MYEAFYGLKDKPFQLNPDPSFYFGSRQHQRAMAYLEYGLHRNEGFIVITGEVGAGKTTLVRNLFSHLNADEVVAATLVSTQLDAENVLRMVASAFGIATKNVDKSDLLMAIEAFLVTMVLKGKRCLLVVDEAQNLAPQAVEELRMLSNFQLEKHALLQSFLVGQPEFREILQSPRMTQLRQRVIAACHIGPMDAGETRGYIEHRLRCVGWTSSPSFSDDAHTAIFAATGGIPRQINSLCDRLLLFGYLTDTHAFTPVEVKEVAKELSEETIATGSERSSFSLQTSIGGNNGVDIPAELAEELHLIASNLTEDALTTRLANLERSIVRLERGMLTLTRSHSAALALLERLLRQASSDKNDRDSA